MRRFRNLSIRLKVQIIIMTISTTAVVLACAAFVIYATASYRRSMESTLAITTEIIGANSTAALEFEDPAAAAEVLSALSAKPSVVFACIYDKSGELFAKYTGKDMAMAVAPLVRGDESRFDGGYLLVSKTITQGDRPIGTVFVQSNLSELSVLIRRQIHISLWIAGAVLVLTFLLSTVLQRAVSGPIVRLAATARRISIDKNYSVRAQSGSGGEIGLLVSGFNQMLEEIQAREHEMEAANQSLEQRVSERTEKLIQEIADRKAAEEKLKLYTGQLERSNKELQDFAYITSHDLQEPLRKIQAFGDRLKAKCAAELGEQGADYLDRMQSAAQRMRNLINSLLDYSRVTTKARPFTSTNLKMVVNEALSDLEIGITKTGARMEIGDLPAIDADLFQMRQLFQNLIGNALKYCRPEEPPVIKVRSRYVSASGLDSSDGGENGFCEIVVSDNGIGFEQKYADRIFGVFQRLHGRGEYEGTGVGLAICRKIVERHHGSITANGEPGKGATFVVLLPIKQERANQGGDGHDTEESTGDKDTDG